MKRASDQQKVLDGAAAQRGVFSTTDLRVLLAERHPAAFKRRVNALLDAGVLSRFSRGMYVHGDFDAPTLSQRLGPTTYLSFGTVLARHLVIGSSPKNQLLAAGTGRARTFEGLGLQVVHVHLAEELDFGHTLERGVRWADPEKAALDSLYFHLRGRRYTYDVYSDLDLQRLQRARLERYLEAYRNPKFVAFARDVLELA